MQNTHGSVRGASEFVLPFWSALPEVVRMVLGAGLRITVTILVARALLTLSLIHI